ncbi:MAG: DUF4012 domain-containing protein [Candidatus Promineifilaceae bacterium]
MKRFFRTGCLTLSIFCLIFSIWAAFKIWRLYALSESFQEHISAVELLMDEPDPLGTLDAGEAVALITDVRTDMVKLKAEVEPYLFLAPYLTWLPKVGPLMVDAGSYLELADAGTATLSALGSTIELALASGQDDTIASNKITLLISLLKHAEPDLDDTREDVSRITDAYFALQNREDIPYQLQPYLPLLDKYLPLAEDGVTAAQVLPELLGTNEEKTFLLWAQNADELRPTGGYISGAGLLRVKDGDIVSMDFTNTDIVNSYDNLDLYGFPPEAMQEFMGLDYFLFRDANYWPNFPISAEKGIELYNIGQPNAPQIDGVIAFDQYFVQLILNAIGPVYVPELERNVAAQTILTDIQAAWSTGEEGVDQVWFENRKRFIGDIAQSILEKLLNEPGAIDITRLGDAILDATEQRHLLVHVRDEQTQTVLKNLSWDGHFEPVLGQDQVFPVDMNVGYNKANAIVNREFRYEVDLRESTAISADLFIRYQHAGVASGEACVHGPNLYAGGASLSYNELINLCYFNFLRVYTPVGSQLLDSTSHPAPEGALLLDRTWNGSAATIDEPTDANGFWNFMVLPQGELLTTHMRYTLPETVIRPNPDGSLTYQLTVHKQAGTLATPMMITVQLPSNATLLMQPTPNATVSGNVISWQFDLERDETFELQYQE